MCAPQFRWHWLAVAGQISRSCASSAVSLILLQGCGGCDKHCSGARRQSESVVVSCVSRVKIDTWPLPHCTAPSHRVSLPCSYPQGRVQLLRAFPEMVLHLLCKGCTCRGLVVLPDCCLPAAQPDAHACLARRIAKVLKCLPSPRVPPGIQKWKCLE